MRSAEIINDAYRRCNRLSPGEVLSGDDLEFGLLDLNVIVDELSAKRMFLYKALFTSNAQTGNITTGAAPWTAVPVGEEIRGVYVDNVPLLVATPEDFASIVDPTLSGIPYMYSYDGYNTISLYPRPAGQTLKIMTGTGVTQFADFTTEYLLPPGYKAYLGARLAVKRAPSIAKLTVLEKQNLDREETKAALGIMNYEPAILNVHGYGQYKRQGGSILYGWY